MSTNRCQYKRCKMPNDKPFITYSGDDHLISEQFAGQITRDLPQEGIEWQRSYGRAPKVVYLEARLVKLEASHLDIDENNMKLSMLNKPLLHTFWTECSDVETYKNTTRDAINTWMQKLKDRNIADWFIIHVDQSESRKGLNKSKLLPRSSVLDKIKSDFPNAKSGVDRSITLLDQQRNDHKASESYQNFLQRLRMLLLQSHSRQFVKYEEYIRTQRENRNAPNWNFFDFFFLQEELAFAFEMLSLYDEALVQYDELDALFSQFVINSHAEDAPEWLLKLSEKCDNWNGLCLSSTVSKSLREQIKQGQATLLDLRNYLFSRQCELLMLLNKPWELASRSLPFLQNCVNELNVLEINVIPGGIACWVFLSASEILQKCERYSDSSQLETYFLHTVGLWAYARNKLAELGTICSLMPDMKFTSECLLKVVNLIAGMGQDPHFDQESLSPQGKLKEALSTQDSFLKHYLEISELTMGIYKHIGRIRNARLIGMELAQLYLKMNNSQKATSFLIDLEKMYLNENWPCLLAKSRQILLETYEMLDDKKRQFKIHCHLAACMVLSQEERLSHFTFVENFIDSTTTPTATDKVIFRIDEFFPLEDIVLNLKDNTSMTNCDIEIELNITSNFPKTILCEELAISLRREDALNQTKCQHQQTNINTQSPTKFDSIKDLEIETFHTSASVGVKCQNPQHVLLRRSDSFGPFYDKELQEDNYDLSFSGKQMNIEPGLNVVKLKFHPDKSGSYVLNQVKLNWNSVITFISASTKHVCFIVNE